MKKILLLSVMALLVAVSCTKPGCTDLDALNFNAEANEDDGTCEYPVEDPRVALEGNYLMKDSAFLNGVFTETKTYSLQAEVAGGSETRMNFSGLFGEGEVHFGDVDFSDYTFDMPSQLVAAGSGQEFTGTGSFYGDFVEFNTFYTFTIDGDIDTVTTKAVGDK